MYRVLSLLILISLADAKGYHAGGGHATGGHSSSSGGSHSYPHSTGYSGHSAAAPPHSAPTYPHSTGHSGHGPAGRGQSTHTTVHHHYHYSPPQQMHYGSQSLPVYHGAPPVYVYEYRNSGSRYDTLLTGLALYNLGRMSERHDHRGSGYYNNDYGYNDYNQRSRVRSSSSTDVCKLGVQKENGGYEETRVSCDVMTSFLLDDLAHEATTKSSVVNVNVVVSGNATQRVNATAVQTAVTDALQAKGPSIAVTPKMQCFLIRVSGGNVKKTPLPCGVLKTYAEMSLTRVSGGVLRLGSLWLVAVLAVSVCRFL